MNTFYWHDYETWGAQPSIDRPSQFAGVRTDENLNIIDSPLVIYCQPPEDLWPHPEACLVTGLTPQVVASKGLPEREFIAKIHQQLATPKTCGVGYNSIRFDDEVTRYTLYRNFYDPYEREWRNGNSRWDIIDMVRLVYALRPDGIEWPVVDGKPSFKLENLTAANDIGHTAAHDAYSDVEATINLAKLIKNKKTALYDFVCQNRSKQAVMKMMDFESRKPLLHISSQFPSTRGCVGLIAPIAMHPVNKNAVICYELSVDPSPLAELSAEQIHQRVFTREEDLPEGQQRLPIKLVHLNKSPILTTPKLLDADASRRLGIDKTMCERHWQSLKNLDIADKLRQVHRLANFEGGSDPETQLYDGFIGDADKREMAKVRDATVSTLVAMRPDFSDARLKQMFSRYLARNHFDQLSDTAKQQWHAFVRQRLLTGSEDRGSTRLSYEGLMARIQALTDEVGQSAANIAILSELRNHALSKAEQYQLDHPEI
ncbi:MAG: exodeoxyribonuclease I [Alteromonadaceae bacterium]|nr:MAG: exodeoxyribonuclease I [Alteromonadaceae bacterium]